MVGAWQKIQDRYTSAGMKNTRGYDEGAGSMAKSHHFLND